MRKQLYWLSDAEWGRLEPLLPRGRRGAPRVDDRRVISGIMHMLHSGSRGRDCPAAYGPYTTIYNRFNRWSRKGNGFVACLQQSAYEPILTKTAGKMNGIAFVW